MRRRRSGPDAGRRRRIPRPCDKRHGRPCTSSSANRRAEPLPARCRGRGRRPARPPAALHGSRTTSPAPAPRTPRRRRGVVRARPAPPLPDAAASRRASSSAPGRSASAMATNGSAPRRAATSAATVARGRRQRAEQQRRRPPVSPPARPPRGPRPGSDRVLPGCAARRRTRCRARAGAATTVSPGGPDRGGDLAAHPVTGQLVAGAQRTHAAVGLLARRLVRLDRARRREQQHQPGEQVVGEPDQDAGRAPRGLRAGQLVRQASRRARRRRGRSTAAGPPRASRARGSPPAPGVVAYAVSTATESGRRAEVASATSATSRCSDGASVGAQRDGSRARARRAGHQLPEQERARWPPRSPGSTRRRARPASRAPPRAARRP